MASKLIDLNNTWNRDTIKSLRLRLGWSQADLARRLNCASAEIESWERGVQTPALHYLNELFLMAKQADACSHEVHVSPLAESLCDQHALGQIGFSEIKEDIE